MSKLGRWAFGYYDPRGEIVDQFAQCSTCKMWTGQNCMYLGPDLPVSGDATCIMYAPGEPAYGETPEVVFTPEEVGFEERQVRCENCGYYRFTDSGCSLFSILNKQNPTAFDLEVIVHPQGCCNANVPISGYKTLVKIKTGKSLEIIRKKG